MSQSGLRESPQDGTENGIQQRGQQQNVQQRRQSPDFLHRLSF